MAIPTWYKYSQTEIRLPSCSSIHEGSCLLEFLIKLRKVCKIGMKYYVLFHLIPLMLKLRNARHSTEMRNNILKSTVYYGRSIMFMGMLVAITKSGLCFFNNHNASIGGIYSLIKAGSWDISVW